MKRPSTTTFILIALLTLSTKLVAFEAQKTVVDRNKRFNAITVERTLTDLTSADSYEGKYFKIVLGKEDSAIKFDTSEELQLKAATTYYHLTKARNYFINTLDSGHVKSLPQIVIRINISNKFSELGHFAHDNLDPEFNNALSIPSGIGYPRRGVKGWNNEIWFRPGKRVHISEFGGAEDQQGVMLQNMLRNFRNQTHMITLQRLIANTIMGTLAYQGETFMQSMMRTSGTSLLTEAIFQSTTMAANFFTRKWYYLDAALVPEIIYHEFAHVALSDHLEITHSTSVNEGMADFFAGKIANSKALATKIEKYNLFSGKKVRKKDMYRLEFERTDYANADFVFGLLWQAEDEVLKKQGGDKFIYQLRTRLDSDNSIRDQLVDGFVKTCEDVCSNPFLTNLKLYKLFHYKGL